MNRSADRVSADRAIKSQVDILRGTPVFSGLNEAELLELAASCTERALAAGEFVFWEGDVPDWFYVVAAGQVKVLKQSASGKEFIVAFFNSGEMFGEVAVFEGKPYPASAQAVTACRVVGIARKGLLDFLAGRPEVALRIISVLGGRLREAQGRLKDLAVEKVEQRLAGVLLMLSRKLGPTVPFTRQEIADMTGTTTETAIRTVSRLKDSGIVRTTRGRITVVDPVKLRLLSEGPPRV